MTIPPARLAFFKLIVPDMAPALAFWQEAFGFAIDATYDLDEFIEHLLYLPDQPGGPNLILLQYCDGREIVTGNAHGPVGFICTDIVASHSHATSKGALPRGGIVEPMPGVKVAMLKSPQGHAIELVQLPR